MNTRTFAFIAIMAASATSSLPAQRRGTDGRGSSGTSGRATPSGSPGKATSGGRGGSSSGTSRAAGRDRGSSSGSSSGTRTSRGSGKIGAIARAATRAEARARGRVTLTGGVLIGECWECSYWGYYGTRWGWYHGGWWYPSRYPHRDGDDRDNGYGPGYEDYPYASDASAGTFALAHTNRRHAFGAVSGQYFADAGSTTRAGRFGLEGAFGVLRGEVEYSYYGEPVTGGKDELQTYRFAVGVQPRLGDHAYLIAAIGARGLAVNGGHTAGGPEGELGVQLLPRRPFGFNVTGRIADLTWNGQDYFTMRELNTTGSIFVNRVEIQAGWHWLKVAGSPAFGGPVAGLRLWF